MVCLIFRYNLWFKVYNDIIQFDNVTTITNFFICLVFKDIKMTLVDWVKSLSREFQLGSVITEIKRGRHNYEHYTRHNMDITDDIIENITFDMIRNITASDSDIISRLISLLIQPTHIIKLIIKRWFHNIIDKIVTDNEE